MALEFGSSGKTISTWEKQLLVVELLPTSEQEEDLTLDQHKSRTTSIYP